MGLYKEILQDDGITTNYHRIEQLNVEVNRRNTVIVLSYVSEDARNTEKNGGSTPYQRRTAYFFNYDPDMSISNAYERLKTIEPFIGAVDVLEESSEEIWPPTETENIETEEDNDNIAEQSIDTETIETSDEESD